MRTSLAACLASLVLPLATAAQCANPWSPGVGGGGTIGWPVLASAALPNGDLVLGGFFLGVGAPGGVVQRSGGTWSTVSGLVGFVSSLTVLQNGDIVAGGELSLAGLPGSPRVARWNGSSWSSFGFGNHGVVHTLSTLANGDLVVGGIFFSTGGAPGNGLARWDGTTWSAFGTGTDFTVRTILELPNGDILIGGDFTSVGGVPASRLARWNGSAWSPFGGGADASVLSLRLLANGDVLAAGDFSTLGGQPFDRIARWNGSTWAPLGTGLGATVTATLELPDGDILAGGAFVGPAGAARIARWDGATWTGLGGGADERVETLTRLPGGDVVAGGRFTTMGGVAATSVAQLTTTCPASAVAFGSACPSSGGANLLTAVTLPWVEGTFRARGTGLPTTAVVVAVTGLSALVPGFALNSVFAVSPVGCLLHVSPDIQQPLLTTTGSAESSLFLPASPSLVGVTFSHQMVAFEFDLAGNFVEITSTNALQLTAGVF